MAPDDPGPSRWLYPLDLVQADAYPLFDGRHLWPALALLESEQPSNLALDRVNLEIVGTLPLEDALAAIGVADEERRPAIVPRPARGRGHDLIEEAARGDDVYRERQHVRRHQPFQVFINRLRLALRIRKDRAIRHRRDLAMR